MSSLVMTIELALVGLLGFLTIRLLFLYRNGSALAAGGSAEAHFVASMPARSAESLGQNHERGTLFAPADDAGRDQKLALIAQLHILYSLQEQDARRHGVELGRLSTTVHGFVAAWVYGAACALVPVQARHSNAIRRQVAHLVARKLSIRETDVLSVIDDLVGSSSRLVCFRCGLEGAEHWQHQRFVPGDVALYRAITANALV